MHYKRTLGAAAQLLPIYLGLAMGGLLSACGATNFGSSSQTPQTSPSADATAANAIKGGSGSNPSPSTSNPRSITDQETNAGITNIPSEGESTGGSTPNNPVSPAPTGPAPGPLAAVPTNFTACSQLYAVPATSNPFLAGVANTVTLTYNLSQGGGPNPTDTVAADAPVLVAPVGTCLQPGNNLYFTVSGMIAYAANVAATNANGELSNIVTHQLGAILGKSNITAPINSLLGVFLGNEDPTNSMPPPNLDFSQQSERDYTMLAPQIGQIFFIGTGMTSAGVYHQVTVPHGATRLYFATMDEYQWNNNLGTLRGAIMTMNSN